MRARCSTYSVGPPPRAHARLSDTWWSDVPVRQCYSLSSHTCDCAMDRLTCEASSAPPFSIKLWSAHCGCHAHERTPARFCYNFATHVCDCGLGESECGGPTQSWTDQCASTCAPAAAPRDACYDVGTHTCDCGIGESECVGPMKAWTDRCTADMCVGGGSAAPPP